MKGPRSGTARLCFWSLHVGGHLALALLFLHGSVLFQAFAEIVEMRYNDSKILCLYVKWRLNFSVDYETENNEYKTADFPLPNDTEYDGSDCGDDYGNILVVKFGQNNYWNLTFSKSGDTYEGAISFTYNTNDTALFPDAKRKGPITVVTSYPEQPIQLNTLFVCDGVTDLRTDNVTQHIWEVTLQAFIPSNALSEKKMHCSTLKKPKTTTKATTTEATTTAATTTTTTTTAATTTTTAATTTTTAATTTSTVTSATFEESTTSTSPVPVIIPRLMPSTTMHPITMLPITLQPWAKPAAGTYAVRENGIICLLATMALQLNISEKTEAVLFNINPNSTEAFGTCGNTTSSLTLKNEDKLITFNFAVKNTTYEAFYLKEVKVITVETTNVSYMVANSDMDTWEATLGSSFMCQKESVLGVTPFYKINVYNLQVQPFDVRDDQFSTAEECYARRFLYLIPVIVGAVVGFLLLVAFIVFIRRRRKKEANPQSV